MHCWVRTPDNLPSCVVFIWPLSACVKWLQSQWLNYPCSQVISRLISCQITVYSFFQVLLASSGVWPEVGYVINNGCMGRWCQAFSPLANGPPVISPAANGPPAIRPPPPAKSPPPAANRPPPPAIRPPPWRDLYLYHGYDTGIPSWYCAMLDR